MSLGNWVESQLRKRWSSESVDKSDDFVPGCLDVVDSYCLTLFNDLLSQSRYADVKELSYTSNHDVPNN